MDIETRLGNSLIELLEQKLPHGLHQGFVSGAERIELNNEAGQLQSITGLSITVGRSLWVCSHD